MNILDRIAANPGALGQWSKQAYGYFMFPKLEGEVGPKMSFRGKEVLNWGVNNYYGLASNPEIRAKEVEWVSQYGLSHPMGSRLMTGNTFLHEELEERIADFVKKEDAFVLNSFYQGMISVIDSLCGRNDVIVYNSEAHSSIHDGIRLQLSHRFAYHKNEIDVIETQLKKAAEMAKESGGGVLLVTEGVIGVTGEFSPLDKIVALKEKYDFLLVVEDAHGFGTVGPNGIGVADHFNVMDKVDVLVGTLGKALSISGGFVAGSEDVINFLRYNMRSQTFSEALPSAITASAIARLDYLVKHPELRKNLWEITNALQKGLRKNGLDIGNTQSPITPVYLSVENMQEAIHTMMHMREEFGIFCVNLIYPYIEQGKVMVRLIPTTQHTMKDVEYTIESLSAICENAKNGMYKDSTPIIASPSAKDKDDEED